MPVYKDFSFISRPGNDVGAIQSVATDGTHIYVTSGSVTSPENNLQLIKYDSDYSQVASVNTASDGPGTHNQINGIYWHPDKDRLFVAANNHPDAKQSWVLEYDTDLNFLSFDTLGNDVIEMMVEHDGSWWSVYNDRHAIDQWSYDEETNSFTLETSHSLPGQTPDGQSTQLWQAILWLGDVAYLNAHDATNERPWISAYRWTGSAFELVAQALQPPTTDCTQGVSLSPDGMTLLWAERIADGEDFIGHVVESGYALGGDLPFDYFKNARGGFSTRKLSSDYTGSAVRVRRSSDGTEQDIGFSGNFLDETALSSFVGTGSGFVTKVYNQAAGLHPDMDVANDLTQTTASQQPKIVDQGSVIKIEHRPAMLFSAASSQCLTSRSSPNIPAPNTYLAAANSTGMVTGRQYVFDGDTSDVSGSTLRRQLLALDDSGNNAFWGGNTFVQSAAYATGFLRHTVLFDEADSYHRIDGEQVATGNPGTNTMQLGTLGGNRGADSDFFEGHISELLWWRDTFDTAALEFLESDQVDFFSSLSAGSVFRIMNGRRRRG